MCFAVLSQKSGHKYPSSGSYGKPYGKPYNVGDIITITFNIDKRELSFSKNDINQGVAFNARSSPPILHGKQWRVSIAMYDADVTLIHVPR